MADPPTAPAPRPRWTAAAGRWALALAIGVGGAYAVRRGVSAYRARAGARLVVLDFVRFQSCLLALPAPSDGDAADRALALALGSGDAVWPHTCAPALARLAHESDEVADDDAQARELAESAHAMENQLAVAEIWVDQVQHGNRTPPTWIAPFVALRREVLALSQRRGIALPAPEPVQHPRVPRLGGDPVPVPLPVPLAGGDEADLVDATATPTEVAVLLRDRRSQYSVCRAALPIERDPARGIVTRVHCDRLNVPAIADTRDAAFVPSERGAHLAIWSRAPSSARGLVDWPAGRVELVANGQPDAHRDYWVGAHASMGLQITGDGVVLMVAPPGGSAREVPLATGLDVLTESRALIGTSAGAAAVWIDPRNRRHADVMAIALGPDADPPGAAQLLARFAAPRMTGVGRLLIACSSQPGPAFIAAGDDRGAVLFRTDDARTFVRGPELRHGIDRATHMVCDATGATIYRAGNGSIEAVHCDGAACVPAASWPIAPGASTARVDGRVLVADAGGAEATVRVRSFDPGTGAVRDARIEGTAINARAITLVHQGSTVGAFVAASRTHLLISTDGGATFTPVLAELPAVALGSPAVPSGVSPGGAPAPDDARRSPSLPLPTLPAPTVHP